ncbi:MAG: glutathione S-transferase family protein [Candidatus Thiodiazotropha taylori]|nr:glutathione S-transferase family protein [Candidatus Thiodiazotropha taylori]MCG8106736.1 glutathione S-transferase family protein [Candidatus Thiodiazotropha taylori]MCG8110766.1 glutathione S-transferase family protein [Candidatus Thiodiazotropha taylori]MCW4279073.1 glutathione S-transferase family protein [Candidatus Thiodiazotropha taylori]MCW4283115.1 glutathione S-transferase family protein [Candidatus Thiodiazotropha taylori]
MNLKLVSFAICPFVQRSVILLREKQIDHEIEYIDLNDPPEWFLQLSPTGKVPLLLVDGATLFESSVILAFLDESFSPGLQPADTLRRAQHRAWIEYASTLLMAQHAMATASDEATAVEKKQLLEEDLARLSEPLSEGLFTNQAGFSLVDAAIAPLFMRIHYLAEFNQQADVKMPEPVRDWSGRLLQRASVQQSVLADFADRYKAFLVSKNSWLCAGDGTDN